MENFMNLHKVIAGNDLAVELINPIFHNSKFPIKTFVFHAVRNQDVDFHMHCLYAVKVQPRYSYRI